MLPKLLSLIVIIVIILSIINEIQGHGRLIEPPSRASAWRYGFDTPHNYNDHELYCGGFTRQWVKNEGKCGVCGDAWDSKVPRAHEYGGTYGKGVIVRKYNVGGIINIRVELTANHFGYFEFSICPDYKTTTQDCLSKNILKLIKPQDNVEHQHARYFPKEGNRVYEMKYRLPKKSCQHCLLQWRYIAGNNWGNCPNGTGAIGCGPQEEFRACADITITGKSGDDGNVEMEIPAPAPLPPVTTVTSTSDTSGTTVSTILPTTDDEPTNNPITTLIISIFSFLVVFLIFSLLFIHFYQVGRQLKMWLKGGPNKLNTNVGKCNEKKKRKQQAPLPPPRIKKFHLRQTTNSNINDDIMHEIDLKNESLA